MSSPRRSPMFFNSSPFIGVQDTSRRSEISPPVTTMETGQPTYAPSSEHARLSTANDEDDVESLPSYGTVARDFPPTYCTYGICAVHGMSCIPAKCCIDRELRMASRREDRNWPARAGTLPALCLACGIWSFAILFAIVVFAPEGSSDTKP
ncbi:hypothetical protein M409DRAFT_29691 [Zasmidium cellare ATCC 36951]|uniref:Uncharacterized protein n=1 Tax=Zasmidium cellare ATCC 36951 TaxID=1080233 RepID=A0A6A6C211_ZASCE|nr:uncharacterized protein M409DRAFT_29691 [Zasmidium cellare ATCC 36951]KAF2159882.1 hypothetical protein M409DRAFT_29691 [Zasmidium cellare ATCC 36951]